MPFYYVGQYSGTPDPDQILLPPYFVDLQTPRSGAFIKIAFCMEKPDSIEMSFNEGIDWIPLPGDVKSKNLFRPNRIQMCEVPVKEGDLVVFRIKKGVTLDMFRVWLHIPS